MIIYKTIIFSVTLIFSTVFSQSYEELQKLQNEYKKVLERQSLRKDKEISDTEKTLRSTALPEKLVYSKKDVEELLINTEKLIGKLKFYEDSTAKMPFIGYDFFTNRDTLSFWKNLPTPKNYFLGPGDELIISLWGESNSYDSEIINRDGQIFIDNIGLLNIGNKTIDEARTYILSKYSKKYSTLIGESPKSFIDLTLGELKSINVHFVGFVKIPGIHVIHPFSNIISGLIQAGGVNERGTLRSIAVLRNNKIVSTADIYDYILKGKLPNNVRLMDQDIVFVSSRKSTIPITGRVIRPGYYELKNGENLNSLIEFAGGRKSKSSELSHISRNSDSLNSGYLINLKEQNYFEIVDGDSVHIPTKPDFKNFVNIAGQVKNPGYYPFNKTMSLNDIVLATMSFNDDDFKNTMNLEDVIIYRKNLDGESPLSIKTSIDEDIKLKNGDYITIPKLKVFQPLESVIVTGQVNVPGVYPVNNLTTLSNIINSSGGLTPYALENGIEIFRDSLKIAWNNMTFNLKTGDSLNVLKKSGLVQVKGEVNVPGYFSFKKNDSIESYIKKAGGYNPFADKKNIYVTYPNGSSLPRTTFSSPKVQEGSIIIVGQRSISNTNNISGWDAFRVISTQAGSIATTLLSLSLLINQN